MTDRYAHLAPFYDAFSGEYPVYRTGRVLGVAALGLTPGAQVLDLGCGTGLNFPLLQRGIGPGGLIVGIDLSARMLDRARRRAARAGWENVVLMQADATTLDVSDVRHFLEDHGGRAACDAALATYTLSLMSPWRAAWDRMHELTAPGGRLSVVDMQEPVAPHRWATPLARLACRLGGADITAHPWQAVEQECSDLRRHSARGGHLQVRAGARGNGPASPEHAE